MATLPLPERPPAPRPSEDPLAAALRCVAEGDQGALRTLYDVLAPRVLGVAKRILRDAQAAEEVAVDVFAQVWRQAPRYEPRRGSVATWVLTLARTRAIDLQRSMRRRQGRELLLDEPEIGADPLARSPLALSEAGDRARVVEHALAALAPEQRRALEAAFFRGMSHAEIASAFGEPLGTVKGRIRAALAVLRISLSSWNSEDS